MHGFQNGPFQPFQPFPLLWEGELVFRKSEARERTVSVEVQVQVLEGGVNCLGLNPSPLCQSRRVSSSNPEQATPALVRFLSFFFLFLVW